MMAACFFSTNLQMREALLLILLTRNVDFENTTGGMRAAFCSARDLSGVDHMRLQISKTNLGIKAYFIVCSHHNLQRINQTIFNGPKY